MVAYSAYVPMGGFAESSPAFSPWALTANRTQLSWKMENLKMPSFKKKMFTDGDSKMESVRSEMSKDEGSRIESPEMSLEKK